MRLAIIRDINRVNIDGVARTVDLSTLDSNIHAIQWNETVGHIEFKDHLPEVVLDDISIFQIYIDAWVAAEPAPPTLNELKSLKKSEFITEGIERIAAQVSDWDSLESIKTVAGMWISHIADNATIEQIKAKDIYLFLRDTVPNKLSTVVDQSELDAIDPTLNDPFGDGTPWPT